MASRPRQRPRLRSALTLGSIQRQQRLLASAPGGGPYFFSPQSAWQNMLFTGASRIVKTAVVDIKGLAPIAGGGPARRGLGPG